LAFYDIRTKKECSTEEIVAAKVLFFASVYKQEITQGNWEKIGKKLPLEEQLLSLPPVYIQSPLSPQHFEILDGSNIRAATKEECIGLESMTIWSAKGIEKRLNDHFAGRYNQYVDFSLSARIAEYYSLPKDAYADNI
jgi:hypothetical protein